MWQSGSTQADRQPADPSQDNNLVFEGPERWSLINPAEAELQEGTR